MVRLAIDFDETNNLVFLSGKQNYKDCIETLRWKFLPFTGDLGGENKMELPCPQLTTLKNGFEKISKFYSG